MGRWELLLTPYLDIHSVDDFHLVAPWEKAKALSTTDELRDVSCFEAKGLDIEGKGGQGTGVAANCKAKVDAQISVRTVDELEALLEALEEDIQGVIAGRTLHSSCSIPIHDDVELYSHNEQRQQSFDEQGNEVLPIGGDVASLRTIKGAATEGITLGTSPVNQGCDNGVQEEHKERRLTRFKNCLHRTPPVRGPGAQGQASAGEGMQQQEGCCLMS